MKLATAFISGAMLALLGSASTLQAQEVRWGAQIHWSVPMDDLKTLVDNRAGFGGGAHMTVDFGGGHILRPRLDYVVYPENANFADAVFGPTATGKAKASDASLGLDYIYDFGGKDGGFFLSFSIAWHRWKSDYNYIVKVHGITVTNDATFTSDKLGFGAGLGYNFNRNFGMEVRYVASEFEHGWDQAYIERTAGSVQVSGLYRF